MNALMTIEQLPPLVGGWDATQIHTSSAHPARIYDYCLSGKDNYAVDRDVAEEILAVFPRLREIAQANRAFLGRAVRAAFHEYGICQLLDIGTGLPAYGHIGAMARASRPDSRSVFVDLDPIVVTHAQALLCDDSSCAAVQGDLRDPNLLLAEPALHEVLDLRRPVALVLGFVLHYLSDADGPYDAVRALTMALAPGSVLILSHATAQEQTELVLEATALYADAGILVTPRAPARIAGFFDGLELVAPGLVAQPWWRPDQPPPETRNLNWGYGALAVKA